MTEQMGTPFLLTRIFVYLRNKVDAWDVTNPQTMMVPAIPGVQGQEKIRQIWMGG
jgi:hypothetical protein